MNDDTTPKESTPAAPSKPAIPRPTMEDVDEFGPQILLDWFKANGTPLLVGVLIAALAYAGIYAFRSHKRAQEITAQSMLFNSQASQQFQDIVDKYSGTAAAPMAALSLGGAQFEAGQYDQALKTYKDFLAKNPTHGLASAAEVGIAQCEEAMGKFEDALKTFDGFLKTHTNSFLYSQAVFGKGRVFEQMGRYDDARVVYEDFIAAHPRDPFVGRAQNALLYAERAKRAGAGGMFTRPAAIQVPMAAPTAVPAPAPVAAPAPAAKP